jgi:hypothetical protein
MFLKPLTMLPRGLLANAAAAFLIQAMRSLTFSMARPTNIIMLNSQFDPVAARLDVRSTICPKKSIRASMMARFCGVSRFSIIAPTFWTAPHNLVANDCARDIQEAIFARPSSVFSQALNRSTMPVILSSIV